MQNDTLKCKSHCEPEQSEGVAIRRSRCEGFYPEAISLRSPRLPFSNLATLRGLLRRPDASGLLTMTFRVDTRYLF